LRDGRGFEWEDASVMTKNSDLVAGMKPRKPSRTSSLISAVLRRPKSQAKTVMICQSCEMTGGPFAPGEAALLLAVHEQLHHGGLSLHRPPLPPAV
jgi:hypothetical protein